MLIQALLNPIQVTHSFPFNYPHIMSHPKKSVFSADLNSWKSILMALEWDFNGFSKISTYLHMSS